MPVLLQELHVYGDPPMVEQNEACLNMLKEIGSVDRIPDFIKRAKDKNDPFRVNGIWP